MYRYIKEKKVIRNSQHGFPKGSLHLTNLITFYKEMTAPVDEGRVVDVVCLDLVSHITFTASDILFGKAGYQMH